MRALRSLAAAALFVAGMHTLPAARAGEEEHAHGLEHEHHDEHEDGLADKHEGEHGEHGEEAHSFTVADFERSGVGLAVAGPGEVDRGIELPGEVRPNADRIAHIAPRFPGLVREVRKGIGSRVEAGEVLAIVESDQLASFEIRAAFGGVVVDKHIAPGESVSRDEPAFIVADLSTVWVLVSVYQSALPQVRIGDRVRIVASFGGAEAESKIAYISPVVHEATRTATARVELANPDGSWRPGLFVTATIERPEPAAVVIPRHAVQTVEGHSTVFAVVGEKFEARTVELGRVGHSRVEVTGGLQAGERIASDRSFLVKAELTRGEGGHED